MASLNTLINHTKYIRSNWIVASGTFVLSLTAVIVVGTLSRAGGNALADCNYGAGVDGCSNYTDTTGGYGGGYGSTGYGGYSADTNIPVTLAGANYGYRQGTVGSGGDTSGMQVGDASQGTLGDTTSAPDNSQGELGDASTSDTSQTPLESPSPSPTPSPSQSQTQNATATANATNNVVINQTPQVRTASSVRSSAAPVTELPQTGPGNLLVGGFGIAGVIVASSLYAASRRDLQSVPFKLTN